MSEFKGKVDFSGFAAQLATTTTKRMALLRLAHRGLCETVANNIVFGGTYSPGTPKDTGFARASWILGINEKPTPTGPAFQPAEDRKNRVQVAVPPLMTGGISDKDFDDIYLVSNCAYMRPLEFGHSKQAPQGMIRMTVAAAQRIADAVCRRVLTGARRGGLE